MARQQAQRIADLELRVAALEARLNINSTNSSKPPSSDPPGLNRSKKQPSKLKRGGQPGHPGNFRMMSENPDSVTDHYPSSCTGCGNVFDMPSSHGEPSRYQVTELPEPKATINEHRLHCQTCTRCGLNGMQALD